MQLYAHIYVRNLEMKNGCNFRVFVVIILLITTSVDGLQQLDCFTRCNNLGKVDVMEDTINALEGGNCMIGCYTEDSHCVLVSDPVGWPGVLEYGGQISYINNLRRVKRQYTANITFDCVLGSRTLSLNIMYGPERADIHGPYAVDKGSHLNLSCHAEANPPANYWWKYSTAVDAPVIAKGATISLPSLYLDDIQLYCFAQNTMVPTGGSPVTSQTIQTTRHITINQAPAQIVSLPSTYTTYSGFTLDLTCDVEGIPYPEVWWSKKKDPFIRNGHRLMEENVQESFAGVYVCNAKNIAKQNTTRHATKEIVIKIVAQYQFWTLAVTISGWLATLVVLIMALVFILRRKRQREHYRRMDDPPVMRLSETMRVNPNNDHLDQFSRATVPSERQEETGPRKGDMTKGPTENTWNSLCKESINNSHTEETRRKTVYSTESDTARLHNVV